jgi:hypothetical protein
MKKSGNGPADEVKPKKPQGSEMLFHIIPKNIQAPHITHKMKEPAMEKHIGKNRYKLIGYGKIPRHLRDGIFGRHKSIGIKKSLVIKSDLNLDNENKKINGHQKIGHNRKAVRWLVISDGYH